VQVVHVIVIVGKLRRPVRVTRQHDVFDAVADIHCDAAISVK
jgi:hypothetical protein